MKANLDVNKGLKDKDTKKETIGIVTAILFISLLGVYWKYHSNANSVAPNTKESKSIDTVKHQVVISDTIKQPVYVKERIKEVKEIIPKKKKDTTVSNSVESQGDNSHIINGNNNTVGVNGDVNINAQPAEPELTEIEEKQVIEIIGLRKKEYNISSNKINIGLTFNSNASKFKDELSQFLTLKGYNVTANNTYAASVDQIFIGLWQQNDDCLTIIVGTF